MNRQIPRTNFHLLGEHDRSRLNVHDEKKKETIDFQESIIASPVAPIPSPITPRSIEQPTTESTSANIPSFKAPTLSPSVPTTPSARPIASSLASTTRARRPRLLAVRLPVVQRKIQNYKWANKKFLQLAEIIDKKLFDADNVNVPFEYFKMVLSNNILDTIKDQTNLYSA